MRRKILVTMVVTVLAMLLVPEGASAGKPSYGCAPGFDLGALTLEQALQLPNAQAAIADGVYTVADVTASWPGWDKNGDGLICFQSFPANANPASLLQYYYNVVDNNASVPSG